MEEHVSDREFLLGWKNVGVPSFLRFTPRYLDDGTDWKPYMNEDGGPMHADFTGLVEELSADGIRLRDPHTAHPIKVNVPETVVLPLQSCSMEGYECKCPGDVSAYLSSQYGSNWHVPVPEQEWGSEEQAVSYVSRILEKPAPFLTNAMKAELASLMREAKTDGS
jgi:hypothetical protein